MTYDSLSLSQPLYGGGYNQYLLAKMQNKDNPQSVLQQVEQSVSKDSLMNSVSHFASELHSQNLVRAMAAVQQAASPQSVKAPAETSAQTPAQASGTKGTKTDRNENINLSSRQNAIPETEKIPLNYNHPIELNKKTNMAMRGMQAMSLDNRSLNVLSRVAQRKQDPDQTKIQSQKQASQTADSSSLGNLAEKFESAQKGSQIIGYDRNGGTSYGTYQLSSRAGTFDNFLAFLDKEEPEWAKTLRKAGKANTGNRHGAVPAAWKKLCAENPERMKELEHSFIVQSHYEPVLDYVQKKWNDNISPALKEVIFSTAVQHGVAGAKRVIDQALSRMSKKNIALAETEKKSNELLMAGFTEKTNTADNKKTKNNSKQHQAEFIKSIYENRKNKFGSSTVQVQQAAKNRFVAEQKDALAMLG